MFYRYLSLFILLSFTFLNSCGVIYFTPTIKTFERDEINADSKDLLYQVSKYPINLNSEIVTIETRYRTSLGRSGKIIKSTYLKRDLHYHVDYKSGKITFLEKIDKNNNDSESIFVVINYDYNKSMYWGNPS
jgi:hypothetical protein